MKYDYLIVGAGFFGAISAYELTKRGKKCLVIDKRSHIGGNAYCEKVAGINVHKYGAHIFHTSNERVWKYVNDFCEFNRYTNSPVAYYKGEIYNLPFNMNTFNKLWGVVTPEEAEKKIKEQTEKEGRLVPSNLEEKALLLVGRDIYERLVKGYTEKQWGRKCTELPEFIIRRLPLRFTYDNNYFNDKYQGIPIGGYNVLFDKWLKGIDVRLDCDFSDIRSEISNIAEYIIYTGAIDEYYDYSLGKLEYRSLKFNTEIKDTDNYQGNAVVNYTEKEIPYTRIIEHKHFENTQSDKTVITYEYPATYDGNNEPYYSINDDKNNTLYSRYKALADKDSKVFFGGRLGSYKYYDMDKVIAEVLDFLDTL